MITQKNYCDVIVQSLKKIMILLGDCSTKFVILLGDHSTKFAILLGNHSTKFAILLGDHSPKFAFNSCMFNKNSDYYVTS